MYVPAHFRMDDLTEIHAFIEERDFATLVSIDGVEPEASPFATHLPLMLDRKRGPYGTLIGHVARANPQWKQLGRHPQALAIFSGPHAYVSPSWYEERVSVPTWNYLAIHAHGTIRLVHEPARLRAMLDRLVDRQEAQFEAPWSTAALSDHDVAPMLGAIVGLELEITRLDGKAKLSQNRSAADRAGVIEALLTAKDPAARATGALMRARESHET